MQTLQTGANTPIEPSAITVAIDWPLAGAHGLDASAYLVNAAGKVRGDHDMVFFNQPSGGDGAITVAASDKGSIRFEVNLAAVPADVEKIVFCVTVDSEGPAGSTLARHAGLSLVANEKGGATLVQYAPELGTASEAAMMVAELYRRNGWKLRAVGQGFNGGLGPLARSFGILVDEPAPAPPPPPPVAAPPPPPPAPPSAPVRLTKISLDKTSPTVSLEKRGASFGEIKINLNWNRGKKGFFGGGTAIDLDVGCLVEMANGDKGCIQALGNQFGRYHDFPYVELSGDDRSGDATEGETIRVNGAEWAQFRRIAIFAYIYQGAPNWASTDGVVTITAPDQPPIEVRMTEGRNDRGFCGIAVLENVGGALKITRLVEYFRHHADYDERLGFGMRWTAGRKD
jgi:tellurite resistance protein TerA